MGTFGREAENGHGHGHGHGQLGWAEGGQLGWATEGNFKKNRSGKWFLWGGMWQESKTADGETADRERWRV